MSRSGFFRNVQNLFLGKKSNVHAAKRHHHFRHPEEGASRPGFLMGLGQVETPAAVGAEILSETKQKGSQLMMILLVLGLVLYLRSRIF